jgi:hypothetical protein
MPLVSLEPPFQPTKSTSALPLWANIRAAIPDFYFLAD